MTQIHTAFKCTTCGRMIHVPRRAQPGYRINCYSCGSVYHVARPGQGTINGFQAVSLPKAHKDQIRRCSEPGCPATFLLSAGEQKYYSDRGLVYPTRCPDCRARRKQQRRAPNHYHRAPQPKSWLERLLGL